jgi:hydrogenase maturation protein HypF
LFDGVAYLAGLCERVDFEAEAGMLMQRAYKGWHYGYYDFEINEAIKIDFKSLIEDKKELIPTRFLNTIGAIIFEIAKKEQKFVLLSGGVFQNTTLLNLVTKLLKKEKIDYYFPSSIPINDGGISLGQLWWVLNEYKKS